MAEALAAVDFLSAGAGTAAGGAESIGLIGGGLQAVLGGIGAISSGNSAAAAAKYNSQVASQNAQIAQQNATFASQAGEEQVAEQSAKTRATVGAIQAAQAANNIDVNSGSALDVKSSASALGELSALNIRSNAARTAYSDLTQETSYKGQSNLDTFEAEQSQLAGEVGAGSSILGSVGNAGLNYAKYVANAPGTISPSAAANTYSYDATID